MKIIERTHDILTGEINDVERDLTPAEIAEIETRNAKAREKAEADSIKAAEKAALLEKLGITADEAALLLS
jgi:hypothetical protein